MNIKFSLKNTLSKERENWLLFYINRFWKIIPVYLYLPPNSVAEVLLVKVRSILWENCSSLRSGFRVTASPGRHLNCISVLECLTAIKASKVLI